METPVPKLGFYFPQDSVAAAWLNIETYEWAKHRFEKLQRICNTFLAQYPDEKIYQCILSMHSQTFAYGISGCPYCRKSFPYSQEIQNRMFAPFPNKQLTCPNCSRTMPDEKLSDEGQGFMHDGMAYYPVGMWNFHTAGWLLGGVRDHEGMVTKLTYMYMLTGEQKYACTATAILDAFAAIYPGTLGPRDFTPFDSKAEMGRLHLLTSIVYRIKVFLAQNYDWLYHFEDMETPSPALVLMGEPGTIRDNIERMLHDYMLTEPGGPVYNLADGNLTELHNHEADGVRAMLAVGLVTDKKEYCDWGIRATDAFLSNAVGRDGMYFEGSYGYSMFTITVFLDMALLSMRAASGEPQSAPHPFANERFFRFAVQNPMEMLCQGHLPCYGDWGADRICGQKPDIKALTDTYRAALHFYHFSPEINIRKEASNWLDRLYPLICGQLGDKGMDLLLQHPSRTQSHSFSLPTGVTIAGQAGIGILRDANETTALMRIGANHTHAHDDVLGLNYYAYGKEISADLGYGIYGSNSHFGWAAKSIAHNAVVVNEDNNMKKGQLYKSFAGGEFTFLYRSPTVTAYEGQAPALYGLDAYQRMIALVPLPDRSSYLIDFFYIRGARTCDYSFRAFHEKSALTLEGVRKTEKVKDSWTLAGVEGEARFYFNQPGKSFGERLTTGETFSPLLKGEKAQYWTPVPNNGYGFIYDICEYKPQLACVKARWQSTEGYELIWHGLLDADDRVITGQCPNLEGTEHHPLLVIRSHRHVKQYAALVHTTKKQNSLRVTHLQRLPVRGGETIAFSAEVGDGQIDFWAYSPTEQTMLIRTRFGEWRVEGRCGFVRTDQTGKILTHACIHATSMTFQGIKMPGKKSIWFPIKAIDHKKRAIRLDPHLIPDDADFIRIAPSTDAPAALYAVKEAYSRKDSATVMLRDSFSLSKGIVASCEKGMLRTQYPLPLGAAFQGKLIRGERGGRGLVEEVSDLKSIRIRVLAPFSQGEAFDITDIEEGYWAQWL
ncbi:hypothetical protein AM501_01550 [Aneurinibacillus migulanus]|uniref:heparinase II/III domain-containing protein n=1 Tax=Aneurinibacillus migulanus TaxID=47500 RepID=UPI0005BA9013|nr:heparinase II/III family protein [Aneurinibacillus migulanus]KIV51491.1 hypothetical protein TS64_23965 [Aneurinibacillus migulanus]KPD09935.1 hypothetical protein AM501_01550 [Aneurinibacillus migulanus]MCP1358476.1 heparinase II/III family protein [Aneurinibacillus migulanus]CEH31413.1 Heparinase II/III-like protein [Aneurinibacillus migulanus]